MAHDRKTIARIDRVLRRGLLGALVAVMASNTNALLIDFESVPGAVEGLPINTQFSGIAGVTFDLVTPYTFTDVGNPTLIEVGEQLGDGAAFERNVGSGAQDDTPIGSPGVGGSWFLSDDGVIGAATTSLLITYSTPVSGVSGILYDIDFNEHWTITGFNVGQIAVVSTTLQHPEPAINGDGVASPWSLFTGLDNISYVRIDYTGTGAAVGFALDDFNTSEANEIPEPLPLAMAALSLTALFGIRGRRRARRSLGVSST